MTARWTHVATDALLGVQEPMALIIPLTCRLLSRCCRGYRLGCRCKPSFGLSRTHGTIAAALCDQTRSDAAQAVEKLDLSVDSLVRTIQHHPDQEACDSREEESGEDDHARNRGRTHVAVARPRPRGALRTVHR